MLLNLFIKLSIKEQSDWINIILVVLRISLVRFSKLLHLIGYLLLQLIIEHNRQLSVWAGCLYIRETSIFLFKQTLCLIGFVFYFFCD